jgi:ParB family transcriptional regulator, chromosome partitioning protein
MTTNTRKISEIKIGYRHRKEMGDLQALADSIKAVGLLHPVVINTKDELIAGARRIEAVKRLGLGLISVTVVDLNEIVKGEFAENDQRKSFTPSEAVAIKRMVEPEIAAEAKARQAVGGKLKGKSGAKLAPAAKGKTRDKVSRYTGIKRTSLKKAEAVIAASEAEPENKEIAGLVKEMDATGKIDGAYQKLTAAQDKEAKPKPATNGAAAADQADAGVLLLTLEDFQTDTSSIDIETSVSGLSGSDRAVAKRRVEDISTWLNDLRLALADH